MKIEMRRRETLLSECPICGSRALRAHCPLKGSQGKNCIWFTCGKCNAYGEARNKHRWTRAGNELDWREE